MRSTLPLTTLAAVALAAPAHADVKAWATVGYQHAGQHTQERTTFQPGMWRARVLVDGRAAKLTHRTWCTRTYQGRGVTIRFDGCDPIWPVKLDIANRGRRAHIYVAAILRQRIR
jgi:hypothetical protein